MIKTYLGIEIGNQSIKFAVCTGDRVKDFITERLPDNIVKDGSIISWDKMADFIKDKLKKHRIGCRDVAIVLPEDITYVRRFLMPHMTVDQLRFNLPYEFHNYITEEKDNYFYDYGVMGMVKEENNGQVLNNMDILAAAVSKETIEKYRYMLKRGGLKLRVAAPESQAYQNIVRKHVELHSSEEERDYAILDIGHNAVNLRIFIEGKYETSKEIELGLGTVNDIISDTYGVDEYVAESYKMNNENNILYSEECMSVYSKIALEVMRVLNFFTYNHPNNTLDTLYCCGGGTKIEPLMETLRDTVGLKVKGLHELLVDISEDTDALKLGAAAVGITWN